MPKSSFLSVGHHDAEMSNITSLFLNNLSSIKLEFSNGRVWEITLLDHIDIASKIKTIFQEYHTDLVKIDFCIHLKN